MADESMARSKILCSAAFTAVPNFLFLLPDQTLYIARICVYAHISAA
jgi:hypothetical protein